MQTITDVVLELDTIIAHCAGTKNKAGYFAALYKRMTLAVAQGVKNNSFEDGVRMEKLDVNFAKRYIDAYYAYVRNESCSLSWKFAFDSCNNNDLTVIQHLLLGINTHINLDLAIAAAITSPGDSITDLQNDFNKINDVIASLVDDVQEALCEVWLPMRLLTKIVNGKQEAVLNFSIDKARTLSWANAFALAEIMHDQQAIYIQQMDITVKNIGLGIASPGMLATSVLQAIRATEYDDVSRTINLIDTTTTKK